MLIQSLIRWKLAEAGLALWFRSVRGHIVLEISMDVMEKEMPGGFGVKRVGVSVHRGAKCGHVHMTRLANDQTQTTC